MDDQPPVDRTILLPILIGAFSIFGILIILLMGRLSASRAAVAEEPTETPFKYIFLGTEPGPTGTVSPEGTEADLFTGTPFDSSNGIPTPEPPGAATPTVVTAIIVTGGPPSNDQTAGPPINITSPVNTSLPTSNPGSGPPPLSPGTYDDVHPYLAYDGPQWAAQTGVNGAHEGTLHVSQVPGSSVTFRFIGTEVRIFYLAGTSLGEVTITIDNQTFTLDQSDLQNGNEWVSPPLTNATHNVSIRHASGGSVNLDYVIIPVAPTPTPTPTRTPTP